jgi:hypothetical protein
VHCTKNHKILYKSFWTVWIFCQMFVELHFLCRGRLCNCN